MKSGGYLFLLGGLFYIITGAIYYFVTREPVGTTALILTAGLAELVAFYLLYSKTELVINQKTMIKENRTKHPLIMVSTHRIHGGQ